MLLTSGYSLTGLPLPFPKALNSLIPIYTNGLRQPSKDCCSRSQHNDPGQSSNPHYKSSMLAIWPSHLLSHMTMIQFTYITSLVLTKVSIPTFREQCAQLTFKWWKANSFHCTSLSFHQSVVKHMNYSCTASHIVYQICFVVKPKNTKHEFKPTMLPKMGGVVLKPVRRTSPQ